MGYLIGSKPETFVPGMYLVNGDLVTLEDGRKFVATQHHQLWALCDVINHPYYIEHKPVVEPEPEPWTKYQVVVKSTFSVDLPPDTEAARAFIEEWNEIPAESVEILEMKEIG